MGILFILFGTVLMIPVVMFLTLCMANMILADSLIAALLIGILLRFEFHLHPVLCILAGFLTLAGMTCLYTRDRGYAILKWASTLIWGYLAGFFAYDIFGRDLLWGAFFALFVGTVSFFLHEYARNCMMAR